jgi:hypothetical protein
MEELRGRPDETAKLMEELGSRPDKTAKLISTGRSIPRTFE